MSWDMDREIGRGHVQIGQLNRDCVANLYARRNRKAASLELVEPLDAEALLLNPICLSVPGRAKLSIGQLPV